MICQRCGSERVLECQAHADDRQVYRMWAKERVANYAPHIEGICGGDDLAPDICLDCGQVQGTFPKAPVEFFEEEDE